MATGELAIIGLAQIGGRSHLSKFGSLIVDGTNFRTGSGSMGPDILVALDVVGGAEEEWNEEFRRTIFGMKNRPDFFQVL